MRSHRGCRLKPREKSGTVRVVLRAAGSLLRARDSSEYGVMRLVPKTVRMKLALTAAAGLVLTGLMTTMFLNTSDAALEVVARTQADHERMRSFVQLRFAVDRLQSRAYDVVRSPGELAPVARDNLEQARAEFRQRLARAQSLAPESDYGSALVADLGTQGEEVLRMFEHGPELQRAIDGAQAEGGGSSAVEQMRQLSAPYIRFVQTVEGEIQRSDTDVAAATAGALRLQRSMRTAALLGLALGISVTAVIFVLLMLRLGPALQHLEAAARAFGAGRLDHRVQVGGRDELFQLANAFNAMARELGEKQSALEESREGLERAVAQRTAELRTANDCLSAEDERRRRFLAEASHELRMPVTIIRGEAEVALRSGAIDPAEAAETFERILAQTRDLTRLLQDLFLIAHAEAGGLRLAFEEIDLNELVARLAGDFSRLAVERGASVRASGGGPLMAIVDPGRVRQALSALVDNALRHTRKGVNITLEARLLGDTVQIKVDDDGPGIPEGKANDLFIRFRRGPTRGEGSGLGLTVVRALAEAHGGTANLEPSAAGGVCAVLTLPRVPSPGLKAVA
jgi:two-component system OmpR family sensor kinase